MIIQLQSRSHRQRLRYTQRVKKRPLKVDLSSKIHNYEQEADVANKMQLLKWGQGRDSMHKAMVSRSVPVYKTAEEKLVRQLPKRNDRALAHILARTLVFNSI